jgi:hypothetical protein
MYWQVYFHPVTRSAEVILTKILHRAKHLYQKGYQFMYEPIHFYSVFAENITLHDYLKLDEAVILYYFQMWEEEEDSILRDLCVRFMDRNLFKYVEFDPAKEYKKLSELSTLFAKAGLDPEYYLVVDSSSDLPYDFYRPGEEEERLPIQLLMKNGEVRELSRESQIVDAISGKRRTDHKLYFPADLLKDDSSKKNIKKQIRNLLDL